MHPVYWFCHGLSRAFARACFDYRVIGRENLITDRAALYCCNHVSFLDPPLAGVALDTDMYYLARHTLYSNAVARWLFPKLNVVPIDQDRAGFAGLKTIIKLLTEGKRVILFPEGSRSADGQLQHAPGGAGLVVSKARVPVVPMRLFGAWEALPPHARKPIRRTVTVVVGKPLDFDKEELPGGKDGYQQISNRIMQAIAALECPRDRLPEGR
jgi:1-acyl-sn-glycerol-3-phosphate acyltransferase